MSRVSSPNPLLHPIRWLQDKARAGLLLLVGVVAVIVLAGVASYIAMVRAKDADTTYQWFGEGQIVEAGRAEKTGLIRTGRFYAGRGETVLVRLRVRSRRGSAKVEVGRSGWPWDRHRVLCRRRFAGTLSATVAVPIRRAGLYRVGLRLKRFRGRVKLAWQGGVHAIAAPKGARRNVDYCRRGLVTRSRRTGRRR